MNQNNQQLIKASIVTIIIAGLLGALTVFGGNFEAITAKVFAVSLTLILFGITATISMVVTRKPEYKILGNAGMIVSAIAFLIVFIMIIGEAEDAGLLKVAFTFFIASIGLAQICLLHHFNLQNKYAHYARMTATIAIAVFSLTLISRVFEPFPSLYVFAYNQGVLKLLVAALIIDLAATLLVPLCNRLKVYEPVAELTLTDEQAPPQTSEENQTTSL